MKGEDTGGRYSLMYEALPKGSGAPPHKHTWSDEHFYILDGEITFWVDDEIREGRKGDFVSCPAILATLSEWTARRLPSLTATLPPDSNWLSLNWRCPRRLARAVSHDSTQECHAPAADDPGTHAPLRHGQRPGPQSA